MTQITTGENEDQSALDWKVTLSTSTGFSVIHNWSFAVNETAVRLTKPRAICQHCLVSPKCTFFGRSSSLLLGTTKSLSKWYWWGLSNETPGVIAYYELYLQFLCPLSCKHYNTQHIHRTAGFRASRRQEIWESVTPTYHFRLSGLMLFVCLTSISNSVERRVSLEPRVSPLNKLAQTLTSFL